jgi:RimJ/RimL family protein N-acetyltransferase
MFITERLILRSYKQSDVDELLADLVSYQTQLWTNRLFITPKSPKWREDWQKAVSIKTCSISMIYVRMHNLLQLEAFLFHAVLVLKDEPSKIVGLLVIGMSPRETKNRNGDLGIALLPEYRNQRFGPEVVNFAVDYGFRGLGFHRMSLTAFGGNERALKVYERV